MEDTRKTDLKQRLVFLFFYYMYLVSPTKFHYLCFCLLHCVLFSVLLWRVCVVEPMTDECCVTGIFKLLFLYLYLGFNEVCFFLFSFVLVCVLVRLSCSFHRGASTEKTE